MGVVGRLVGPDVVLLDRSRRRIGAHVLGRGRARNLAVRSASHALLVAAVIRLVGNRGHGGLAIYRELAGPAGLELVVRGGVALGDTRDLDSHHRRHQVLYAHGARNVVVDGNHSGHAARLEVCALERIAFCKDRRARERYLHKSGIGETLQSLLGLAVHKTRNGHARGDVLNGRVEQDLATVVAHFQGRFLDRPRYGLVCRGPVGPLLPLGVFEPDGGRIRAGILLFAANELVVFARGNAHLVLSVVVQILRLGNLNS